MSGLDNKKTKRRKVKKATVTKAATQTGQKNASSSDANPSVNSVETLKKLERLMDASDGDTDGPGALKMPPFFRGSNPFLDKDRCLLCHCERQDPPDVDKIKAELEELQASLESNPLAQTPLANCQMPLWVCPSCRKAADQEMVQKTSLEQFMEPDLEDGFLSDISIKPGSEPTTPNGSICSCEACTERRQTECELEQETAELQQCWANLRKVVRCLYGNRSSTGSSSSDSSRGDNQDQLNLNSLPEDDCIKDLVYKLCRRDPHQLFLRLESQVREFVIEMKVKLLKQLSTGFKTPPQAKKFISLLLEEYAHLCKVARRMSGLLKALQDHLKRFKVTWDLHNKHLFQSIVFSEPSIKNSMNLLTSQLRIGAASKETCHEDTYPNLLHRYLKFEDEMSVINVVWRDCHQLIESYNEEQSVLKLKQKMLREDWEMFKAQRKLLEQQVSNNPKATISHNQDAQFTEAMRLMLQGNKPTSEELICPRCNSKRCPCDECTITHMITCGIINPEVLDHSANTTSNHHHNASFLHDSNKYRIDVSPPSMSSTTSSSGSSSPIMVHPERLKCFSQTTQNEEEIQEEMDNQSYDEDDDDEDEDDEDDDDEDDEEDDADNEEEEESKEVNVNGLPPLKLQTMLELPLAGEVGLRDGEKLDSCNCDHCVSQSKLEQVLKAEDNQCQCHVCLQQQGKAVSTSLPQHMPSIVPRPGELHLYPHIHGSSGLHTLGGRRPVLQPSLYDLHLPSSQRHKSIIQQAKVPIKLDFDTPEGINDHIYHAYGDWDNTSYDPRLLLGSGKFDSELLPPPPFSSPYTSSLLSDPPPLSVPGMLSSTSSPVISSVSSTSAFSASVANHISTGSLTSQASTKITDNLSVLTTKESLEEQVAKFSKCANQGSPTKNHNPLCARPATLGGNNTPKQKDKPHSQHCRKHGNQASTKTGSQPNHSHAGPGQLKVSQDFMSSKEGRQMLQLASSLKQPAVSNHPCNHAAKAGGHGGSHLGGKENFQVTCANSIPLPTSTNNVSVSTSTMCIEPDCDGNHDDNYDSIDDNCSEKSSSTSNSTSQKDGKYCDCCYCEFFGHGNPQVAPTSKNYAEMRDKLRLRLKKKQTEGKQDDQPISKCSMIDLHPKAPCTRSVAPIRAPQAPCDSPKPIETRGLDELIKFINGTDNDSQSKQQLSAKAAKRARQKQRKAEEKARQEAEKLKAEMEAQRKSQEEALQAKLQEEASHKSKADNLTKRQKKQQTKQGKSSTDTPPTSGSGLSSTAPCQDLSSSQQDKSAGNNSSSKNQKKRGKHKDEEQPAMPPVRITCEYEQSADPVSQKVAKPSTPPSTASPSLAVSSSNKQLRNSQQQNSARPIPQGSSEPTIPPEVDNRNLINQKQNKNKEPVKNAHLGNGDFFKGDGKVTPEHYSQITIQQQHELLAKKIKLQMQQEAKKQIQLEQIKQQQQLLAQSLGDKGKRGSVKMNGNVKQIISQIEPTANAKPQQQSQNNDKERNGKTPTKNNAGNSASTPTQSPRIQEQNNNVKQGKASNNNNNNKAGNQPVQQLLPSQHQQGKKGKKQSETMQQQNSASSQSPRHTPSPVSSAQQNGTRSPAKTQGQVRQPPQGQAKLADTALGADKKKQEQGKGRQEESPPSDQGKSGKTKKMKKKSRGSDINFIDEVFMPKSESDMEGGELDEFEREIEEFKRFCADSTTPVRREKLQVNVNIKDIFAKKKNGLSVS